MDYSPKKVLIIEDDESIIELLEIHLKDINCLVDKSSDGNAGLEKALENCYDMILLDIKLPGNDGFVICREIRSHNIKTPILMLTSKSDEIDKVLGLELGADDYITKPFGIREIKARVKAMFRRIELDSGNQDILKDINFGDILIEAEKRKVIVRGELIELTPKEYDLLYFLASNPGKTFSREHLLQSLWGYKFGGYEHTVNSHINRLRNKIEEDLSTPKYILTTWGVGYRFNENLN